MTAFWHIAHNTCTGYLCNSQVILMGVTSDSHKQLLYIALRERDLILIRLEVLKMNIHAE